MHSLVTGFHTFHYNSDLSGKVTIVRTHNGDERIEVNGSELIAFVAELVRRKKISNIESQDIDSLLGVTETP